MSVYDSATFVKKGKGLLNTNVLDENAPIGRVLNFVDQTEYDTGDKSPMVLVNKDDWSLTFHGSAYVNDRIFTARPGERMHVYCMASGTISAGDIVIAGQTNVGYVEASTTADDIAIYKVGKAVEAASNGYVLVDLAG
jgi:hypothetical protein